MKRLRNSKRFKDEYMKAFDCSSSKKKKKEWKKKAPSSVCLLWTCSLFTIQNVVNILLTNNFVCPRSIIKVMRIFKRQFSNNPRIHMKRARSQPQMCVLQQLWLWHILSELKTAAICFINIAFQREHPRSISVCIETSQVKLLSMLSLLFLFLPLFCLHTVCNGHHRTEVHLTGHRLPGAPLTDSKLSSSYSRLHIKWFPGHSCSPPTR